MSGLRVCTVAARNYLPYARVLARSLADNAGGRLTVMVLDDPEHEVVGEPFDLLRPEDLALTRRAFDIMATIYDVTELATAIKPWVFESMFKGGSDPVCFLDPDMEVLGGLHDVAELAKEHSIVLTPHLTEPMPRDGLFPDETYILRAGTYNLGFVALSSSSNQFLAWWKERLERDCRIAVEEGLFVDQRWVDLVPGLFGTAVIRDAGFNVAYWNLATRPVTRDGSRYLAAGRPLRLFHYSGFSPLAPHVLSSHQGDRARIRLADHPALARLCSRYAAKLLDAGFLEWQRRPYRYDFTASGERIDRRMRDAYRVELARREQDEEGITQRWLPDPFDPTESVTFRRFMLDPPDDHGISPVPRYFAQLYWSRPDLQVAFPDLQDGSANHYLNWVAEGARLEGSAPAHFLPPYRPELGLLVRPRCEPLEEGVNVVGYLDAEDGIGEVARRFGQVLEAAAVPYVLSPYGFTPSRRLAPLPADPGSARFDVSLLCINADELPLFVARSLLAGAHRPHAHIGVWAWEVAHFPEWMRMSDYYLDEIWVYSEHAAKAIAPMTDKPVVIVPPAVEPIGPPTLTRRQLGLPEAFLFLFCFSYLSVFERKNPLAVVEAFRRAFGPGEGPELVIKSVHGESRPLERARLEAAAAGRPDIHLANGYETPGRQRAMMASCDAYVSLHRAEGFGLTLAEAMSCGKPVVATGFSGNLEFMTETNSYLVPYDLRPVPLGCDPYPPGSPWAAPDVEAAAATLRTVYDRPAEAVAVGERAAEDMARHSPSARADLVRWRLDEVRRGV